LRLAHLGKGKTISDNQGSGCGLVLRILAVLIGVPLFILVIAIGGGEEE